MFKLVDQPSIAYCKTLLVELQALTSAAPDNAPSVWVQHIDGGLIFHHSDNLRFCQVFIWGAVSVELTRGHSVHGNSCIGMNTEQVKDAAKKIFDFMVE